MRSLSLALLVAAIPLCAELRLESGQGQMVQEQFPSAPLAVRALDASGRPLSGLPITWTVTEGQGSLIRGTGEQTDENGYAWIRFVGTDIQPGTSWAANTVTASSSVGVIPFTITTVQSRAGSGPAPQPSVQFLGSGDLRGAAGSTITEAFVVQVVASAGIRLGQGIPNIGIRLVALPDGSDPATVPFGTCNAPGGLLMTDARGYASCNLVLNRNVGTGGFYASIGESVRTRDVSLTITPGEPCTVTLSTATQNFTAAGGAGTVNVTSGSGCQWTATTSFPWIGVAAPATGTGNGSFSFSVAANPGSARTGSITVGNQSVALTQAAAGTTGGPLSFIVSSTLPSATVGLAYSVALTASGGAPPYTWEVSGGLPAGLTLNSSTGILSGVPSTAGTYTRTFTVRDSAGVGATQAFALLVSTTNPGTGGPLVITTSSLPTGAVGVPYTSPVTTSGGCQNPFQGGPTIVVASGTLPTGLTLQSASGGAQVAGTPTVAGTYSFALRATDTCGASTTREFSVQITSAPTSGGMTAAPASLSFSAAVGTSQPMDQTIRIETPAPGVAFTAVASSDADWLSISPGIGTSPHSLIARVANYGSLTPRTYTGSISVISQAANSPVVIPVTLVITGSPVAAPMTASPGALNFTPAAGNTAPIEQTVRIETGSAGLAYTAAATSDGNWLTVSPVNGTTPATLVVLAANYATLPPRTYSGTIIVTSQAINSPITIPVTLTVGGSTAPVPMTVSPAAITFAPAANTTTPVEQSVRVETGGRGVAYTVTATSDGSWLSVVPSSGVTPSNVTVRATSFGALAPGTYQGSVVITSAASNSPVSIPVSLTISTAGAPAISPLALEFSHEVGTQTAFQTITVNSTGGPMGFTAVPGTRTGGQWLTVSPTSGSAPASLQVSVNPSGLATGVYQGTVSITPDTTRVPVVVAVTLRVTQSGPQINAVSNGASFVPDAVSPGAIVTIFGQNLGPQTLTLYRLTPLGSIDTLLSNTRVWFDDQLAPIVHTSSTQVTVVVPYAAAARSTASVMVEYNGVRSPARQVPVAAAAPALFTLGGTQGAILNQNSTVNGQQNPAAPGSIISLFGTGEGLLIPALTEGAIASADRLATPVLPVKVTIGGREAEVLYAGSAPGMVVGMFQINARVPDDTETGTRAVVVTVGAANSPVDVNVQIQR